MLFSAIYTATVHPAGNLIFILIIYCLFFVWGPNIVWVGLFVAPKHDWNSIVHVHWLSDYTFPRPFSPLDMEGHISIFLLLFLS